MPKVPVITSPCPLRWKSAPQSGINYCGQCQRQVHNLDGMTDSQRQNFFASCSGEVCVAYTVKRAATIATLGLATLSVLSGAGALAQEVTINNPPSPYCDPLDVVIVGGTTAGKELQWVDESEASLPTKPELPEIEASEWLPTPPNKATT